MLTATATALGAATTIHGDVFAAWKPIFAPQHMLDRVGEPSEVVSVILFLCGPGAILITGADLLVDGGYTLDLMVDEPGCWSGWACVAWVRDPFPAA